MIEHLDPPRLDAFERVVFELAQPATLVVTTPNAEYNATFESLPAGTFRHRDHRFEWTRAEFETLGQRPPSATATPFGSPRSGRDDEALGPPTQMAVFTR